MCVAVLPEDDDIETVEGICLMERQHYVRTIIHITYMMDIYVNVFNFLT